MHEKMLTKSSLLPNVQYKKLVEKYYAEIVSKLQNTRIISGRCFVMRVAAGVTAVTGRRGGNPLSSVLFTLQLTVPRHRFVQS